eukprot:3935492-Prymnesium_polylepis.1
MLLTGEWERGSGGGMSARSRGWPGLRVCGTARMRSARNVEDRTLKEHATLTGTALGILRLAS